MKDSKSETFENKGYFSGRHETLAEMRRRGIDPYPAKVARSHSNREVQQTYAALAKGEAAQGAVSVAGRVVSIRNSGMFVDIYDGTAKI